MRKHTVTLPAGSDFPAWSLWGLGTFVAGEPRELSLSEAQVKSLRSKGFIVTDLDRGGEIKAVKVPTGVKSGGVAPVRRGGEQ